MDHPAVICFGEMLWDFLPAGLFAGGAPFNVGYHLHQLGARAHICSAVGQDRLGAEFLRRLRNWEIETTGIRESLTHPTGYVTADLSPSGDATYTITADVAWDAIEPTAATLKFAPKADALVYGSLAQRSAANEKHLRELFRLLPATALRVFDVNLRAPFDDEATVRRLATGAGLLKLNAAEAARLAVHGDEQPGQERIHAAALAEQTGCPLICITAGERGAGLWRAGTWTWADAQPTVVADTIGAGDSFLACLVTHLLDGSHSDADCLARACRLGEWIAAQRGATPAYDASTPR